jgi:hypothetical protein
MHIHAHTDFEMIPTYTYHTQAEYMQYMNIPSTFHHLDSWHLRYRSFTRIGDPDIRFFADIGVLIPDIRHPDIGIKHPDIGASISGIKTQISDIPSPISDTILSTMSGVLISGHAYSDIGYNIGYNIGGPYIGVW